MDQGKLIHAARRRQHLEASELAGRWAQREDEDEPEPETEPQQVAQVQDPDATRDTIRLPPRRVAKTRRPGKEQEPEPERPRRGTSFIIPPDEFNPPHRESVTEGMWDIAVEIKDARGRQSRKTFTGIQAQSKDDAIKQLQRIMDDDQREISRVLSAVQTK